MHDVSSGIAPSKIWSLFTQPQEIYTYNTRFSNAGNYYVNKSRLNQFQGLALKYGRNNFPRSLRSLPKRSFNKKTHSTFIKIT